MQLNHRAKAEESVRGLENDNNVVQKDI